MELNDKDIRKLAALFLMVVLTILVFILVQPILVAILWGFILAYVFIPVFKPIKARIKSRNIASGLTLLIAAVILILPLWFILPIMVDNVFDLFRTSQEVDVQGFVSTIFPTASDDFKVQLVLTITNGISKISGLIINYLVDFLLNGITIALHLAITSFVFFFTLRDMPKLMEFVSGLSPLSKKQNATLVKHYKDITHSLVYGQVIVGLVQGLLAGLGMLIFGIDNVFVLTMLAVIFSIIPIIGPGIIWVPLTIFLFATGSQLIAVGFLLYNIFITSTSDNFMRLYLISKRSSLSQGLIIVGMIGGFITFGLLGIILGPLILAYFVTFLKAYKEGTLTSLFSQ